MIRVLALTAVLVFPLAATAQPNPCIQCHTDVTPGIVGDWELSAHAGEGVECNDCHGDRHSSASDVDKVDIPTPETCATCHEERVAQFKRGKHAFAWAAMKAMPTAHAQPIALMEGMKGCGGCHKIGLKSDEDMAAIRKEGGKFGVASCNACHTRHLFSVEEARAPQACQTCHMGFDHPQWEMWSASKHGVRALLKQSMVLPQSAAGPTCQTCHMQDGNHEVRTAWGFLAVRLPLRGGREWEADQTTIMQALGVLDPDGKPTERLKVVEAAQVARLTQEEFDAERARMLTACSECHSENFARAELAKGDDMIREADHLLAQAIRIVAGLYKDGTLKKPKEYAYAFPDLLAFHDAPTPIEQRLFQMHLEHRMRAFQGTFHANPDYALWYGWSEMKRDLTEIEHMAEEMRSSWR
ncbi:MAG: multiheme c-type cytochrome [Candidatus Krumholzibacteria bacterium]|nr:multiheme c-type cytochrome [Candidatus Krumholzibacteria bacterium]MDH4338429.1 multiheme c-type cytochrome [Candidatus Krumholzibacteria bacterium]MDH5271137.1 multiheme c-type cytochrome [Candidatus Krumholzibacteria bacterium]MDH5627505.1 multiheme c-type cytochrome [Candidatus Krumholzibacteria bacterium]